MREAKNTSIVLNESSRSIARKEEQKVVQRCIRGVQRSRRGLVPVHVHVHVAIR